MRDVLPNLTSKREQRSLLYTFSYDADTNGVVGDFCSFYYILHTIFI